MNKIYNNLNIENLINTEWFNQFDKYQQEEIKLGLEDNLNVSLYAKPEFSSEEMELIRLGLIDNLDVILYANPEYDWERMNQIREKLLNGSSILLETFL